MHHGHVFVLSESSDIPNCALNFFDELRRIAPAPK